MALIYYNITISVNFQRPWQLCHGQFPLGMDHRDHIVYSINDYKRSGRVAHCVVSMSK